MTSTVATHDSPREVCQSKSHYPSKKSAKLAAKRFRGPTNVYECPHLDPDGGTHWHITRRKPGPRLEGRLSV